MNGQQTSTSQECLVSWARHARGVALVLVACYALTAPLVYALQGRDGLLAATVAAVVCAGSAISAQLTASLLVGAAQPIHAVILAMLFRMAPPLIFCMALGLRPGSLTQAGAVFYVIAFYLITLAIDTWLSVGRIPQHVRARGV